MKQLTIALVISSLALGTALGGTDTINIYGSGVVLLSNTNGTPVLTYYETTALGNPDHAPLSPPSGLVLNDDGWGTKAAPLPYLGMYDPSEGDTLYFDGGGLLTENVDEEVETAYIYYQIDDGAFVEYELSHNEELSGGDKDRWFSSGALQDLLDGLENGDHTISVYYTAESTPLGDTFTEDNGEKLFAAEFGVIPEPAVMGLVLLAGTSTLFIRRIFT